MTPDKFLIAAKFYVDRGWAILPLRPGSKFPATDHGFKDATTAMAVIEGWADAWRKLNIGIACGPISGLAVVDVDPRHGGVETIAALKSKGFTFADGPTVRTGNGGWHRYCKFEEGLRSSSGKLGPGIDFKADGYVVAPPSWIGESDAGPGGEYKWMTAPLTPDLPEMPDWALARLIHAQEPPKPFTSCRTSGHAERRLEGLAAGLAKEPEGNRNKYLYWAACTAFEIAADGKLNDQTAERRLTEAALHAGEEAWKIKATIQSARKRITQNWGAL